jgi:uncharacterized membrane protein
MIALFAVAALFVFVWRTRADLQSTIDRLTRRLEALESLQAAALSPAPRPVPPRVQTPPVAPPAATVVAPRVPATLPPGVESREPIQQPVRSVEDHPDSLETEIGSRWLLYVGVLALVVGAAYFQKLAIDNGWIGEQARVIEGIVAGLALIGTGRWFITRGYDVYGQIIAGGGVAVLYVSVYAAATLYELIGRGPSFAALCAITSLAAALADRYRSQGLAVMAVGGGFLTPFLLPSDQDAQVVLFTYVAVLIAGTMYLAHRRVWPLLNVVSYALTQLTVIAWAGRFYTPDKHLVTEAFLTIFCGMFVYILFQVRRSDTPAAGAAEAVLWSAPGIYYVESLLVLWPHSTPLLVFLGIVAAMGAALAPRGLALIRLGIWISVAGPLLVWINTYDDVSWLVPGLAAASAIYAVTLLSQLYWALEEERLTGPDVAMLHLNPLATYVVARVLVDSVSPGSGGALAFGFAIWNGCVAGALWQRRHLSALHFGALGATFLALAIGLEFDGAARTIGWAVEGSAVAWLGMREGRRWLHVGGLAVFGVAVVQLLLLVAARPPHDYAILLNSRAAGGLVIVTLLYVLAVLHRNGFGRAIGATPFILAANVVTLVLVTTEIDAYWYVRALVGEGADRLGRELMLSVSWALYATVLIVIGLRRKFAPVRYLAIAIFGVTILKVFFRDLAELEQFYRVSSIIALGVLLLLTSYLYNRSRRESPE